ncbi:DJ-1/PfpI family protein [Campylobacter sp. VBCF_02 NA5]|uniref:DJ-1 family glyoxalase III n=1 Tax=Campylobacter sp. VBCF_02 NA5 TaxID=2983834 RepID=UPI0022E9F080|nr:DJ-1 family glyoxalase III [Campylobacter sp. VBCF_02 NA5]MDA3061364.1 DJ-1/PfpI family protein [Campylobacter sp. VBCF_02 NA5]
MKVAVILANGFEEIEAISVVDLLRRAGIDAKFLGLEKKCVTGSHGVEIIADDLLVNLDINEYEMIVLPGGLPGAEHLAKSEKLGEILREFDKASKKIGAICAAPWALGTAGVLKDSYTCYPGFEGTVAHAGYTASANVIIDKNIITSRGPATAMEFALTIVRELKGEQAFSTLKSELLFN